MLREKVKSTVYVLQGVIPSLIFAEQPLIQPDQWNVFLTADYIFWRWNQPLLPTTLITSSDSITSEEFIHKTSTIVDLNPHYTSGFQTGVGFNLRGMDEWNTYAEYTWYKNTVHQNLVCGEDQSFVQLIPGGQFSAFNQVGSVQSQAKMLFNALDVSLQRPFHLGKKILSTFGLGLSNLWITQHLKSNYNDFLEEYGDSFLVPNQSVCKTKQTSWGIGPKIYFDSDWMLGYGIKLVGNISASVLYTKYLWKRNRISHLTIGEVASTITSNFSRTHGTYNFKPITETAFGFGWGKDLCHKAFHIDLSALYDINIYWDYTNMLLDNPQNMILHGLNIQARFDF